MNQPDFDRAKQYALNCLERQLPSDLVYHSVSHTRDAVVPAAERFAAYEVISDEALLLLRTAAWYHDIGFIEHRIDHEAVGVRIAGRVLPEFGYSRSQIAAIGGMIMATKLPQSPQSLLEELLADADLDVLGRSNFFARNQDLRDELARQGSKMSNEQWYSSQLQFLKAHRYWTTGARALRDNGKKANCTALQSLLLKYGAANEIVR